MDLIPRLHLDVLDTAGEGSGYLLIGDTLLDLAALLVQVLQFNLVLQNLIFRFGGVQHIEQVTNLYLLAGLHIPLQHGPADLIGHRVRRGGGTGTLDGLIQSAIGGDAGEGGSLLLGKKQGISPRTRGD